MLEALAAIQHEIWAHWMRYLFSVCTLNEDGSVTIPKESVERWQRQIDTKYENLSEKEKASDRRQANKVWLAYNGEMIKSLKQMAN